MGDMYPAAEVTGIDLSPIQSEWSVAPVIERLLVAVSQLLIPIV